MSTSNFLDKEIQSWNLLPQSSAKPFPDYIPEVLIKDYNEACLIRDLSPKASATLARRCLQGMIRDFWKVKEGTLNKEIEAIKSKISVGIYEAIDAIRKVGNIGAHMEGDINLIIEVEPEEAQLLIELIEELFQEWYINKHDSEERLKKIKATAAAKEAQKKQPVPTQAATAATPPTP